MDGTSRTNDYFLGRAMSARPHISDTAKTAMPGYAGHRPNHLKGKVSAPPSICSRSDAGSEAVSLASSVSRSGGGYPSMTRSQSDVVSKKAAKASPGYSGFVPGKCANGVYGQTFSSANKTAVKEFRQHPAPGMSQTDEVRLPPERFHDRSRIPGYQGYQPGKNVDNLHGVSPHRAAKEGWLQKQRATERGGGLVVLD